MIGGILLSSLIIITLIEGLFTVTRLRKAWVYKKERLLEHARGEFAETRSTLFQNMIEKRINPNSDVTKFVYIQLSYLVRNPDNFETIARRYIDIAASNTQKQGVEGFIFMEEIETWPEDCKKLLVKMADAMDNLVFFYAPLKTRFLIFILQFLLKNNIIRSFATQAIKKIYENTEQGRIVNKIRSLNENLTLVTC